MTVAIMALLSLLLSPSISLKTTRTVSKFLYRLGNHNLFTTVTPGHSHTGCAATSLNSDGMVNLQSSVQQQNLKQLGKIPMDQHLFSVAPMMDYTDRYQRYFQRLISREAVLYTEMVTASGLIHIEDKERLLQADLSVEQPIVLQLGGSDPENMKKAAKIAYDYGYREINLNVGCPSEKVADAGCFGASLMLNPELVVSLCLSISEATGLPATVKCRIGVDNNDSYEELYNFIDIVSKQAGVEHFIVHARKAILGGKLSPADNRKIPPLKYEFVHRLVEDFPHLYFTLNGGIETMDQLNRELFQSSSIEDINIVELSRKGLTGIMVGRAAVGNPWHWRKIDSLYQKVNRFPSHYPSKPRCKTRRELIEVYCQYADNEEAKLDRDKQWLRRALIKPLHNLFYGESRGKIFRRALDTLLLPPGHQNRHELYVESPEIDFNKELCTSEVIRIAVKCIPDRVLDSE